MGETVLYVGINKTRRVTSAERLVSGGHVTSKQSVVASEKMGKIVIKFRGSGVFTTGKKYYVALK